MDSLESPWGLRPVSGLRRCADSHNWLFQWDEIHSINGVLLILITGITRAITVVLCGSVWFYSLDIWHLNYIYNTYAEELLYLLFFTVLYCSLRSMNFQARSKVKHPLIPVVLTYIYTFLYVKWLSKYIANFMYWSTSALFASRTSMPGHTPGAKLFTAAISS